MSLKVDRLKAEVSWLRPGAYMTDGRTLARVLQVGNEKVAYEDCRTLIRFVFRRLYVQDKFRLVKPAGKKED